MGAEEQNIIVGSVLLFVTFVGWVVYGAFLLMRQQKNQKAIDTMNLLIAHRKTTLDSIESFAPLMKGKDLETIAPSTLEGHS